MSLNHICFIVPNYPTEDDPTYTFVKELVNEVRDEGITCTVIAPQSLTNFIYKRYRKRPLYWIDKSNKNNDIAVYQPYTLHFLRTKIFGTTISARLTELAYKRAFKKLKEKPDVLYAHFWHSGIAAANLKSGLSCIVASGESEIWVDNLYSRKQIDKAIQNINGVIAVSTKNKEESIALELASENKINVIPNSVNTDKFYPMNKDEVRKELGYDKDDFIVAFLGSFDERKGVLRLAAALKELQDVKSIFIGSGTLQPNVANILFQGRLPHEQVNLYLNAADVFVLPTLAEGSPNAVLEAMACGLPIISSNLKFNDDILTSKNSIRLNPMDVNSIKIAIVKLRDNKKLRLEMSRESLNIIEGFEINKRAKKILKYINEMKDIK